MVKKLQKMAQQKAASPAGLLDSQLASAVKDSAQQIWLAGMGAFSKAQAEGGKVFEALIKEGTQLQRKTQGAAEDRLGDVAGKMSSMAGDVTAKAGQHWDKLESIFEARTAKALGALGVPTAAEVRAMGQRLDELAAAVAKLGTPAAHVKVAKVAKTAKVTAATVAPKAPAAKRVAASARSAVKPGTVRKAVKAVKAVGKTVKARAS